MTAARELPAACTLDVDVGPARVAAWHRLMNDAFVRLWWNEREAVTVEFDVAAAQDVRSRLLALVRDGRRDCSFLHWRVRRRGPHLRLQVKGPGAPETVAALMY